MLSVYPNRQTAESLNYVLIAKPSMALNTRKSKHAKQLKICLCSASRVKASDHLPLRPRAPVG